MGGGFGEAAVEAHGGENFRHGDAARLLAALAGDALPAFAAFDGGFEEALIGAGGIDGEDAVDAEFGGLLDHPFEAVEFDEGGAEGDDDGRGDGGEGFEDAEVNAIAAGFEDLGEEGVLVIGDFEALAGLDAEDAGEMAGILAAEFG